MTSHGMGLRCWSHPLAVAVCQQLIPGPSRWAYATNSDSSPTPASRPNNDCRPARLRAIAAPTIAAGVHAIGPREISPAAPAAPTPAQHQNHPQRPRCDGWPARAMEEYPAGSDTPRDSTAPLRSRRGDAATALPPQTTRRQRVLLRVSAESKGKPERRPPAPIRVPCCVEAEAELGTDPGFKPLQVANLGAGPLSVGGLLAFGVSGDCVKASISDEPFDRRHGRSYPGPVWVDVCCDAPRVV
jgi:hypothetical protein